MNDCTAAIAVIASTPGKWRYRPMSLKNTAFERGAIRANV